MRQSHYIFGMLLLTCVAAGSSATAETLEKKLELLSPIRELHDAQQNTGFVFAATINGEKVIEDFAGAAIVEHDIEITPSSRFQIMSITKAFTGAALARAVTLDLVDLDQPVTRYLPDYRGAGGDDITLRMLLAHTSGIPHTGHPQRRDLYVQYFADARSALGVFEDKPLLAKPGAEYHYSSAGYNLVAAVIESVSGVDYETFVTREILSPLSLNDTGFGDVERPVMNLVRNYSYIDLWDYSPVERLVQVPTWNFSYNRGGGNMFATVDDLLRFGNALLSDDIFSRDELEIMLTSVLGGDSVSRWSAGWIVGKDDAGRPTVYITGATPGVQASLYLYPQQRLVFAMLANCWGKNSAGGALVIDAPQRVVAGLLADQSN